MSDALKEEGSCSCGAVQFTVSGPAMGVFFCHCRACTRSKGCGPNLVLGVGGTSDKIFTYKDEKKKAKEVKSVYGPMIQGFCDECGSHIYQYPAGAPFVGVYPSVFEYEDGKNTSHNAVDEKMKVENANCILPKHLQPSMHMNYENRLCDFEDKLPKFRNAPKAFGGDDVIVNSDGTEIKKPEEEAADDTKSPSKLRKQVEESRTEDEKKPAEEEKEKPKEEEAPKKEEEEEMPDVNDPDVKAVGLKIFAAKKKKDANKKEDEKKKEETKVEEKKEEEKKEDEKKPAEEEKK